MRTLPLSLSFFHCLWVNLLPGWFLFSPFCLSLISYPTLWLPIFSQFLFIVSFAVLLFHVHLFHCLSFPLNSHLCCVSFPVFLFFSFFFLHHEYYVTKTKSRITQFAYDSAIHVTIQVSKLFIKQYVLLEHNFVTNRYSDPTISNYTEVFYFNSN